jgi:hypothetical protein
MVFNSPAKRMESPTILRIYVLCYKIRHPGKFDGFILMEQKTQFYEYVLWFVSLLTVSSVRLPQKQIHSCKGNHTTETTLQAVRQEPSLHIADCLSPLKILQIKAADPTNTYISCHLLLLTDATFYKFRHGAISTSSKLGSMLLNTNRK